MSDFGLQIALRVDGVDDGVLRALAFRVKEALSTPYEIEIEAASDGDVAGAELLRKGLELLVLASDEKVVRRFEGVVAQVTERFRGAGAELRIVARSPLFALALSSECRIFQAKTAPDIVKAVLASCGVDKVAMRTTGTYVMRDSCTQYDETMLAFVSRLLEEEGITYFFEETSDGLTTVIADAPTGYASIARKISYTPDSGPSGAGAVTRIVDVSSMRPGKVTLRDLAWEKPALDLDATVTDSRASTTGVTSREHYEVPAGYADAAEGKRRAQNLIDAFAASHSFTRMESTAAEMSAGHVFTLGGTDAHDGDWVVVEVVHEFRSGDGGGYGNVLRAQKKATPFRPARVTPRPRIEGLHTAIVTGPDGQEIHTDDKGRVKLKFPWDRHAKFDDQSSAWVRVAEAPLTGSMHLPRIGWEVIVEFLHGDPDRPIVVGRLFNAKYVPPYALPANKTRTSLGTYSSPGGKGHNELRLEDAAGSEHIHVHAQKDYTLTAAGNRDVHVTTSQMTTIKVDQTIHVKKALTSEVKGKSDVAVSGKQSLTIEKDREKKVSGDEMVTIGKDQKTTIGDAHTIEIGAKATLQAGGDMTLKVSGDLDEEADAAIRIALGDDLETKVGGAKSEIAKGGKTLTVGGKMTETVGAAFSITSQKDLSIFVGGKKTSTIGAAFSATSGADVVISSGDALEITAGGALSLTGAQMVAFKVGGSKVTVGQGGVVIDASKVKITSDGPLSQLGALVLSK